MRRPRPSPHAVRTAAALILVVAAFIVLVTFVLVQGRQIHTLQSSAKARAVLRDGQIADLRTAQAKLADQIAKCSQEGSTVADCNVPVELGPGGDPHSIVQVACSSSVNLRITLVYSDGTRQTATCS